MPVNLRKTRAVTPKRPKNEAPPPPSLAEEDQVAAEILKRLRETLSPLQLSLKNLTKAHAKHAESKKGGGGHYEVLIVSEMFQGAPPLQRQRIVHDLLKDLMGGKIHALKLDLKDPSQVKLVENP